MSRSVTGPPGSTDPAIPYEAMGVQRCDRPDCSRPAAASLSYRYAESAVWVGELTPDDHSMHHLCESHADRLRVPQGWELIDLRSLGGSAQAVA